MANNDCIVCECTARAGNPETAAASVIATVVVNGIRATLKGLCFRHYQVIATAVRKLDPNKARDATPAEAKILKGRDGN